MLDVLDVTHFIRMDLGRIGAEPLRGCLPGPRKTPCQPRRLKYPGRRSPEREEPMLNLPDAAPDLKEILIQSDTMPWREKSLKGIAEKMRWRDEASGASIALIRFAKGAGIPEPHLHASNQFMFCLAGRYEYVATGVTLTAGSFYCNPKGHVHGPAIAHEETVVLEIYDGPHYPQKPSWYADEQDAH